MTLEIFISACSIYLLNNDFMWFFYGGCRFISDIHVGRNMLVL